MELTATDWRGYGRDDFPAESWISEGNALRAIGSAESIDLISRNRYRDFVLAFEWRLPPGGNSGLLYRVDEAAAKAWHSGPEMQLLDDFGHPDGRTPVTRCGALYALLAPRQIAVPLIHRYLRARVVVRGAKVEHWLNDLLVLTYDLSDPALRDQIAASKFRAFPRFAREAQGHLVLQHHGTDAWFRHLHIEPI
jgi:hypothetical protein